MPDKLRIGAQIGTYDPFWIQVREAVHSKAQQAGVDLIPIEITDTPGNLTPEEQASLVDEFLAQSLGALICWNLPASMLHRLLELGLPAIYLSESSIRHPRFVSPVGLREAAAMVGSFLIEKLGERGHVLCAGGLLEKDGEDGSSRIQGFQEILSSYPEISVTYIPCSWRYEIALSQLEVELSNLKSPFDAVFGLSDSIALAARDASRKLSPANSKTLIVGINGDPLALAAIADGSMCATVDTPALALGGQVVDLACKAARGEPLPAHFGYRPNMVTAQNVAEVALNKLSAIANLPTLLVGVNRQLEQNRSVQLETSAAINRRIGSLLDRRQLSQEIAKLIQANYGYDRVQLFLWSRHEQLLVLEEPEGTSGSRVCLSLEESGLMGEVMRRNEPIFIPDTYHSNRFPPDPKWPDAVSRVILPIHLGSEILGVLDLHSHRPILHLRLDLIGLQSLADQLGIAMRNADLYHEAVQARKTAEKADQLKTRLLANVSHELRAPMNVILGYTQAALAAPNPYHVQLPEPLIRDLRSIFNSGEQLMRLINDLLDLSRAEIDALEIIPETIEPRSFLDEVFHSMADTAGASGAVHWHLSLPKRLPVIEADPIRLRQIILNLLHNASKFTRRGEILLGAEIEPPYIHLWVKDSGPGIPIELQERIFEPFVSIEHKHRRSEGLGLGLSITRRLVALHGGSMTLESRPHHGSTFHVYLPLPSLSGRPLVQLRGAEAPVLVLLSGNEQVPEALTELCRRRGLSIRRPGEDLDALLAETQPAALAWDLAGAKPKDWTIIQRLRSHPQWCRLPFLVFGQESADSPAPAAGMINIITKPVGGKTLIECLTALQPAQAVGPILVVDDDPEARRVYQSLTGEAFPDYRVLTAGDGAAALAILREEVPSLVLLDLMMPEVDGFTVLEQMRSDPRTRQIPVLVLSGKYLTFEDIRRLDYAHVIFQGKDLLTPEETMQALKNSLTGENTLPQPTSNLVKQALAYLQQNSASPLSRQEIADAVGVSKNYLSEIFRQEIGISPWDCLVRFRIQKAKEILTGTSASITSVAAQVGFDDSAYFSRVFRSHVGKTPKEFRKSAG